MALAGKWKPIQRVLEMLEMAPDEYRPDPSTATATRMKDC